MENFNVENFDEKKAINSILFISNKLKRKDFHKIFKILYFAPVSMDNPIFWKGKVKSVFK